MIGRAFLQRTHPLIDGGLRRSALVVSWWGCPRGAAIAGRWLPTVVVGRAGGVVRIADRR